MGFLRKLFGGGDQDKAKKVAKDAPSSDLKSSGMSNEAALKQSGLEKGEEDSSWLGRAWQGMKDVGAAMKNGAKGGALTGAGLGAMPGLAVGAGVGAAAGAGMGQAKTGAAVGGGLLALPGAMVGGLMGSIAGAGKGMFDYFDKDDKEILAATADIPAKHIIYEQFAHIYAYGKGDEATLATLGYTLDFEYEDSRSGFRVVGMAPKDKGATDIDGNELEPVMAFRGTKNMGGALDDLNREGVGTFQFSSNEKQIRDGFAKLGGRADVTGHSLGGALAQLSAARLGSSVADIITFQAAGINGDDAQKIDKDEHKATHYRTAGDLVHSGGEAFALGEVIQFEQQGIDSALSHVTQPLAQLNALRGKEGAPTVKGVRNTADDEWVIDKKGDYHNGHWKTDKAADKSLLSSVETYKDANDSGQSGIVDAIGGRKNGLGIMNKLASVTGAANRQEDFAGAWKEVRGVCGTIKKTDQIPEIRAKVVDVILEHGVPVSDHGRFISQAEALMIDVLEAKSAAAKEDTSKLA